MKKSKSHQINENGTRLLRELIPPTWSVNEQFSDYGKDFLVEIGEQDGEQTGESFHIQLKSTEAIRMQADKLMVSHSLSSRHARYFAKVKDLPVFLVLMDVTNKVGYFLFIQEWLAINQGWNNQHSITVKVPTLNTLSNPPAFTSAIHYAKEWLRARNPASLEHAARAEIERLRLLDSRFNVSTRIEDGKVYHDLKANTNVAIKLGVAREKKTASQKLQNFIERGTTVQFEPGEIAIHGSDLFELANLAGCQLANNGCEAKLALRVHSSIGEYVTPTIDCRIFGGSKLTSIKTIVANCPLQISLDLDHSEKKQMKASIQFDPNFWESRSIGQLVHFKLCYDLFTALEKATAIQYEIEVDGNLLATIPCPNFFDDKIGALCDFVKDLQRVRKLCSHLSVNPKWSMEKFCQQYLEFCQAEAIILNDGWTGAAAGCEIKGNIELAGVNSEILAMRDTPGPFTITSQLTLEFLDISIPIGRVAKHFTNMKIRNCKKVGKRRSKSSLQDYKIEFVSTPASRITMQLVKLELSS